jgi:hypothetical protein
MFCAVTQVAAAGECSAQAEVSNTGLAVCKHEGAENEDLVSCHARIMLLCHVMEVAREYHHGQEAEWATNSN